MALATPETGAAAVDGDQRDQDEVRLDRGSGQLGLQNSECAASKRVAGEEAERFCGIGEGGEGDDFFLKMPRRRRI